MLEYCKRNNRNFLTYDWFGRGGSSGKLMEATISRWTTDTIEFLEKEALHVKGGIAGVKAVLVGVGVGGWVSPYSIDEDSVPTLLAHLLIPNIMVHEGFSIGCIT